MSAIEKKLSELSDIESVDLSSSQWTWGCNGQGQYFISSTVFDDHIADCGYEEIIYMLPDFMNEMLAQQKRFGSNDAKRKINAALKI